MKKIKVGILRETKNPPDRRVALAPAQAVEFIKEFPNVALVVQPSDLRAYADKEYIDLGIEMQEDITDCDVLIGVKEVKKSKLIADKTYLFFSHTAKKQPYNRDLLQIVLEKNIQLVDYEYLTNTENMRLVAFGRWAGIVGSYNGLLGWGKRTGNYSLKRAHKCHDMDDFLGEIRKVKLPNIKILITGGGRVAHGAMETLDSAEIKKVTPAEFLKNEYSEPVYTQIDPWHYLERKDGSEFDLKHFFKHPYEYKSVFLPYGNAADLFIACHFWNQQTALFMKPEDMASSNFRMKVVADVSCDINGPVPSTIRASTIADPFYGYNPNTKKEVDAFNDKAITVMAVDNLPGEAPRNASIDFGRDLIAKVLPSLLGKDKTGIIERATITKDGKLTEKYSYLQDFADGKE